MPGDVHIHGVGCVPQQMVVERGDLDSAGDKLGHHRIHFGIGEHQIAHDHRLTPAMRYERQPGAERQRRFQGHAVEHHMQVAARQADAIDTARHLGARFADGGGDRLFPGFSRQCGRTQSEKPQQAERGDTLHHDLLEQQRDHWTTPDR